MTPALVEAHRQRFDACSRVGSRRRRVRLVQAACLCNGAPATKLVLSRQGVDDRFIERLARSRSAIRTSGPLRVGFLGRLDPVKGVDVLVDAVRALPTARRSSSFIRGLPQNDDVCARPPDAHRGRPAHRLAPRRAAMTWSRRSKAYDLFAIPSRWLETGPIVALEARAAGRPVAASRRGGLGGNRARREDGWLLPPDDVSAWTALSRDWLVIHHCAALARSQARAPDARRVPRDDGHLRDVVGGAEAGVRQATAKEH
jgi:glycosyltransferase involved in cell wall biosynthesis